MRITISGPPGSGKTTACRKLSEHLGLEAVVFGHLFRKMAAERGLSLVELGELAERDPAIDAAIDGRIIEVARANTDIILESRLSAHLLSRHGIPAFKVYLDADPEVRMQRIGMRDEGCEDAAREMLERQASEARRYKAYYNIDIGDLGIYDLVLSTDDMTPEEVIRVIADRSQEQQC